jgi:hypothetical protein
VFPIQVYSLCNWKTFRSLANSFFWILLFYQPVVHAVSDWEKSYADKYTLLAGLKKQNTPIDFEKLETQLKQLFVSNVQAILPGSVSIQEIATNEENQLMWNPGYNYTLGTLDLTIDEAIFVTTQGILTETFFKNESYSDDLLLDYHNGFHKYSKFRQTPPQFRVHFKTGANSLEGVFDVGSLVFDVKDLKPTDFSGFMKYKGLYFLLRFDLKSFAKLPKLKLCIDEYKKGFNEASYLKYKSCVFGVLNSDTVFKTSIQNKISALVQVFGMNTGDLVFTYSEPSTHKGLNSNPDLKPLWETKSRLAPFISQERVK